MCTKCGRGLLPKGVKVNKYTSTIAGHILTQYVYGYCTCNIGKELETKRKLEQALLDRPMDLGNIHTPNYHLVLNHDSI